MPSMRHEALLLLFRRRPRFAAELIQGALGCPLPNYEQVELQEADLSQLTPTEYHADLVVLLKRKQPVIGIIVEVQIHPSNRKRYAWPLYAAALRAKLRCPTCVLVVTPSEGVARWAKKPIPLGPPNQTFAPLVLGPESVPEITSPKQARACPELAVLSVQAHRHKPHAVDLAIAALAAASGLADDSAMLYSDLVLIALNAAARKKLEAMMDAGTYQFQSDFAKKHFARGEAKGEARGRAEGAAQGETKGRIEALLRILAVRGLSVSGEQRSKLQACSDLAQLDAWIERAVTASSTAQLFATAPAPKRASRRR